ncbi:hypothetical protein OQA88_1903 [Cercophora sp. LCS_1]
MFSFLRKDRHIQLYSPVEECGLPPIDTEIKEQKPTKWQAFCTIAPYLAMFSTVIVALACLSMVFFLKSSSNLPRSHDYFRIMVQPCGTTPSEARAKGCKFDVNSFSWLPPDCYDEGLSDDVDARNAWTWWLDENGTIPLSHDEAAKGETKEVYVNWKDHLKHCTVMWRRMHRVLLKLEEKGRGGIDSYLDRYHHTLHCEKMLVGQEQYAPEEVNTIIKAKYPDCRVLGADL